VLIIGLWFDGAVQSLVEHLSDKLANSVEELYVTDYDMDCSGLTRKFPKAKEIMLGSIASVRDFTYYGPEGMRMYAETVEGLRAITRMYEFETRPANIELELSFDGAEKELMNEMYDELRKSVKTLFFTHESTDYSLLTKPFPNIEEARVGESMLDSSDSGELKTKKYTLRSWNRNESRALLNIWGNKTLDEVAFWFKGAAEELMGGMPKQAVESLESIELSEDNMDVSILTRHFPNVKNITLGNHMFCASAWKNDTGIIGVALVKPSSDGTGLDVVDVGPGTEGSNPMADIVAECSAPSARCVEVSQHGAWSEGETKSPEDKVEERYAAVGRMLGVGPGRWMVVTQ